MGCDGGTIPKRHELVRTKKKPEEKDKDSALAFKWQYCNLSNQKLKDPIVACELGKLYNKDAVIELLLDKKAAKPDKIKHINSLKDIHTLVLSKNPSWNGSAEKGDGYIDTHNSKFICPVAGILMNGKYKFCFLYSCNCVLSERALKEVRGNLCPSCSKPYAKETDIITLNGTDDEVEVLQSNMEQRKAAAKAAKKIKREKKKNTPEENGTVSKTTKANGDTAHSSSTSGGKNINKPKNLSTCGVVQGVKHKLDGEKIFQTETFKSLFTSHPSAKRGKDKNGHWTTYNPYHYAG